MTSKTVSSAVSTLLCGLGLLGAAVGCQSNVGGQTLPSGFYLRDDTQFYKPAPETQLFKQRRALEEYKLNRRAIADGAAGDQDQPPAP